MAHDELKGIGRVIECDWLEHLLGSSVGSGNKLSKGFCCEFFSTHEIALIIATLLQLTQEIDPVRWRIETFGDSSDCETGQILDGFTTFAVPGKHPDPRSPCGRKDAHRSREL